MKIIYKGKSYSKIQIRADVERWKKEMHGGSLVVLDYPRSYEWVVVFLAAMELPLQIVLLENKNEQIKTLACESLPWDILIQESGIERRKPTHQCEQSEYIIFSSGSTGKPKGISVPFSNLQKVVYPQISRLGLSSNIGSWCLSTGFDASISDILCTLWSDGCLFISDFPLTNLKQLSAEFKNNNIEYCDLPPSLLRIIAPSNFRTLKTVLCGGDAIPQHAASIWADKVVFWNSYGPTEATISTSMCQVENNWQKNWIGYPLDGVEYKVSYDDELLISGHLASGYFLDQKLTSRHFFFDESKIRWFASGDLVEWDNSTKQYVFIGRKNNCYKRNGKFVQLEEIEKIANAVCPSVAIWHNSGKIVLYCEGDYLLCKKLINQALPPSQRPNSYQFVDKIPRLINGKIDRNPCAY